MCGDYFNAAEWISLKFTERPEPFVIPAQGVTVFVGPNNAGKSLVLRELEAAVSSHQTISTKLLNDFEIIWLSKEQLAAEVADLTKRAPTGTSPDAVYVGRFSPQGNLEHHSVGRESLLEFFKNHTNKHWLASQFLKSFLIRLDGRRDLILQLIAQGEIYSLNPTMSFLIYSRMICCAKSYARSFTMPSAFTS